MFSSSTSFQILGFDPATNYFSDAGIIDADFPLNLLGIQQLKITSKALASYNSSSTTLGESNLVGVIQSTAPPFGMILYSNINSFSVLKNKTIGLIDIEIRSEDGNFIDFNGVDWTLTFQLTIYRKIPFKDASTAFLSPILSTLNKIEVALENQNQKDDSDVLAASAAADPADDIEANIETEGDNSLDVLLYNRSFI